MMKSIIIIGFFALSSFANEGSQKLKCLNVIFDVNSNDTITMYGKCRTVSRRHTDENGIESGKSTQVCEAYDVKTISKSDEIVKWRYGHRGYYRVFEYDLYRNELSYQKFSIIRDSRGYETQVKGDVQNVNCSLRNN